MSAKSWKEDPETWAEMYLEMKRQLDVYVAMVEIVKKKRADS